MSKIEWISVDDKKPRAGKTVDIWADNKRMANYCYVKNGSGNRGNNFFQPIHCGISCVRNATHWRFPPDPPTT